MCRSNELFLVTIRDVFRVVVLRVFLLQLILAAPGAWGQDASTGALRGVVLDAQGAVITNADVVAIRVDTGIRYHAGTDSAGRFAVDLLPPGEYSARAEAEGMSAQISPLVRVEVGAAAQLTFKLKVAGPKETISVSDPPRMVEADPSSVSALLDERAIKDLPLNGRTWWMEGTTITVCLRRRRDGIARAISFRTKWCRSFACRRGAMEPSQGGLAARW